MLLFEYHILAFHTKIQKLFDILYMNCFGVVFSGLIETIRKQRLYCPLLDI